MLNYKLFFDLVGAEDFADISDPQALIHSTRFASDTYFQWKNIDIAIVGLNLTGEADAIRRQLYGLQKSAVNYRILDLGNLRLSQDLNENYLKVSEVCRFLIQENILPILIGGTNDYALGLYWAYQELEKTIYTLFIDRQLDIKEESRLAEEKFISRILLHQPNYLFNLGLLGYQTYFNSHIALEMCKKLNFDLMSVGELRKNIADTEPIIRMADMLCIDIAGVRRNEAPATPRAFHFGLTGEEVVQMAWYAGLNEKLSSLGIFGYQTDLDKHQQTAEMIAVMLWYFIEGFYHRKGEFPLRENFYIQYTVPLSKEDFSLVFYKSMLSERWWLSIPTAQSNPASCYKRNTLIPCTYQDYQEATHGNFPERWIKALGMM
jgi:formiminoglutamase